MHDVHIQPQSCSHCQAVSRLAYNCAQARLSACAMADGDCSEARVVFVLCGIFDRCSKAIELTLAHVVMQVTRRTPDYFL